MITRALALALVCALPATLAAQAPVVATAAPAGTTMLRAGTAVPIRLLKGLTTEGKHLRAGDRFDIEVAEPVTLNGQTIIPVGSHGIGEVTSVRNKGMWGKSGNIEARLLYVRVADRQIRITATFNDKGVTGTGAVVGALALVPIAGFFMTGTSAKIPLGAQVTAYLDEDVPVLLAGGAAVQAPLLAQPGAQPLPAVQPNPTPTPGIIPVAITRAASVKVASATPPAPVAAVAPSSTTNTVAVTPIVPAPAAAQAMAAPK